MGTRGEGPKVQLWSPSQSSKTVVGLVAAVSVAQPPCTPSPHSSLSLDTHQPCSLAPLGACGPLGLEGGPPDRLCCPRPALGEVGASTQGSEAQQGCVPLLLQPAFTSRSTHDPSLMLRLDKVAESAPHHFPWKRRICCDVGQPLSC